MHKVLNFDKAQFIYFFLLLFVLFVSYIRIHCQIQGHEYLLLCFLLWVLCFTIYIQVFDPPWVNFWASQVALVVKNMPANARDVKRHRFDPWMGKIPWRRAWEPTPVFLPRESHGQSSLAGYSRDDWSDLAHTQECHGSLEIHKASFLP